jgi:hypothetical protein
MSGGTKLEYGRGGKLKIIVDVNKFNVNSTTTPITHHGSVSILDSIGNKGFPLVFNFFNRTIMAIAQTKLHQRRNSF